MTWYESRSLARRTWGLLAVLAIIAGLMTWAPAPALAAGGFETEELRVTSGSGADQVELDVTLYIPNSASDSEPVPAIIFPHGYGGTKEQPKGQATKYARQGYFGITYTARGFGSSTGEVSLNAPDYEIADTRTLIDLLSERSDVVQDGEGDPHVGILGGSYAGAVALLTAAYDQRVDVISASRTWNSLVNSLFPNSAGAPAAQTPAAPGAAETDGVFKKLWGQFFFEGRSLDPDGGNEDGGGGGDQGGADGCGGLRQEYCDAYEEVLATNQLTDDMQQLLERSSPSSVIGQITAPTLLVQGEGDKLFPLSEADANARGIAANGTPVKLVWTTGGHGAFRQNQSEGAQLDALNTAWFDFYLRGAGADPGVSFDYTEVSEQTLTGPMDGTPETVATYPGLTANAAVRVDVPIVGEAQGLEYPAGGSPGALSSIPPGFTAEDGGRRPQPMEIPDQAATFETEPLADALDVIGSPVINVRVASSSGEAVLFGKVYDVGPGGEATLVQGLVAPVRLVDLPESAEGAGATAITLPAMAHSFQAGHQLRVVLSSTDQGYGTPDAAAEYEVALAEGATGVLSIPDVTGQPAPEFTSRPQRIINYALIGGAVVAALLIIGAVYFVVRRRSRRRYRSHRSRTPQW